MINDINTKYRFNTNSLYFYFLTFFFSFLLFRIILPLGDEADYFHRFQYYIFNFEDFLYYSMDFNRATTCNKNFLKGELFDIYLTIAPFFCSNSFEQIFERGLIGLYINLPYFILIYILFKSKKLLKFLNIEKEFNDLNMHIFFCSITYPTIIYYLSTRSNEIFLYYFVLLFFFTWRNYLLSYLLCCITFLLDTGNGILFFAFISFFYLIRILNSYLKLKVILFSIIFISILLILFHDYLRIIMSYIFLKTDISYFENLANNIINQEENYKFPNFVKLIITYLSFIFLTPGFLKSTTLIIIMTSLILYAFLVVTGVVKNFKYENLIKNNKYFNDYLINLIACLSFVLLSVLILPTHSFIRYYIFIFPFVFSIFFLVFNLRNTFLISFYAILFISIETVIFRILYFL